MNFLNLSNKQFEQSLLHIVGQERKNLKLVLEHIREADSRKFYLEKGRKSLYDYLTKDLGYSSSSAQRRIEGARLLKEIPQISAQIEEGKINLSQICELSKSVKQASEKVSLDQKRELLKSIECKTTSETQQMVAQSLDLPIKVLDLKRVQKDESVRLEMTLTKEQYEKLQHCRDLASHTLLHSKSLNLSDVIEFLCDHFEKSTAASAIRRVKNPRVKSPQEFPEKSAEKSPVKSTEKSAGGLRKCITPKIRSEIRQKYQICQHRDPLTQNLCGSSFLLQVDHIQPRWAGGNHEADNLTLLCANHNQEKYKKESNIRRGPGIIEKSFVGPSRDAQRHRAAAPDELKIFWSNRPIFPARPQIRF